MGVMVIQTLNFVSQIIWCNSSRATRYERLAINVPLKRRSPQSNRVRWCVKMLHHIRRQSTLSNGSLHPLSDWKPDVVALAQDERLTMFCGIAGPDQIASVALLLNCCGVKLQRILSDCHYSFFSTKSSGWRMCHKSWSCSSYLMERVQL